MIMELADLTLSGNLFQMFGAAEWKACKPKLVPRRVGREKQ